MVIMIALVGEQPLPNFFPIHHYRPEEILFVYTTKTQPYYQHLQSALQKQAKVHELPVHPYNVPEITTALQAKLEELNLASSSSLLFNVTGGTKPMMIAAYQIAQKLSAPTIYLQSEGKQTRIYEYTWEDQQLSLQASDLVPECITLSDVFDLYYGPGNWFKEKPGTDKGGQFEQAIARTLRDQGYEVITNVKVLGKQVDMDVVVRIGNQYGIIEAKFGQAGEGFKAIQQLTIAWRSMGTYVQKFHVIMVNQKKDHKIATEALGIKVISLLSYDETTKTFSLDDQKLLLAEVEKALKG